MRLLPVLALLFTFPCASAQAPAWVQLQGGAAVPRFADCLKTAPAFGLAAGQWLTPRWGWQAALLAASPRDSAGQWQARELHLDGSVLFGPFSLSGPIRPFLEAGLGASRLDNPLSLGPGTTTRLNLVSGLGVQWALGGHGLATLEARAADIYSVVPRTEVQGLMGLGLRWGAQGRPAPRALPPPVAPLPEPEPAPQPRPLPAPVPIPAPVPLPAPEPLPAPRPAPAPPTLEALPLAFPLNQATLAPQEVEGLRRVALELLATPGSYTLVITGHTCSLGSRAFNRALSLRRAQGVAKVLVAAGVDPGRLKVEGLADTHPAASNATRAGRARNRRTELELQVPAPGGP